MAQWLMWPFRRGKRTQPPPVATPSGGQPVPPDDAPPRDGPDAGGSAADLDQARLDAASAAIERMMMGDEEGGGDAEVEAALDALAAAGSDAVALAQALSAHLAVLSTPAAAKRAEARLLSAYLLGDGERASRAAAVNQVVTWAQGADTDNPAAVQIAVLMGKLETLTAPSDMPERVPLLEYLLRLVKRDDDPEFWAQAQSLLGAALLQTPSDDHQAQLRRAIACFDEALSVQRRETVPEQWARTLHNKGAALTLLAEEVDGTSRRTTLREALACFDDALLVRRRESAPMQWAMTESSRAGATLELADAQITVDREERVRLLGEAVEAYDHSVAEYTLERDPQTWAECQFKKGNALFMLARDQHGKPDVVRQAIACYDLALRVRTRDEAPYAWAQLQNAKGTALDDLAEHLAGMERVRAYQDTVACYDAAIEVYALDRDHGGWAIVRLNKATTLLDLATHLTDEARTQALREALTCSEEVLAGTRRDTTPDRWARAQDTKGKALRNLAKALRSEEQPRLLDEAITCFDEAIATFRQVGTSASVAMVEHNKGNALQNRADVENAAKRVETLRAALACFEASLQGTDRDAAPIFWANSQHARGNTLRNLALASAGEQRPFLLREAVECFESALGAVAREDAPEEWATIQSDRASVLGTLAELLQGEALFRTVVQADEAAKAALAALNRDASPMEWARVQGTRGVILMTLAGFLEGDDRTSALRDALDCFGRALLEFRRDNFPMFWAIVQNNRGMLLLELADVLQGGAKEATLREAVECSDAALQERRRETAPLDWAKTQLAKAQQLRALTGMLTGEERKATARDAVASYDQALEVYTRDLYPSEHRLFAQSAGMLLFREGDWVGAAQRLGMALDALDDLYALNVTARGRQGELSAGGSLSAHLAYALARAGGPDNALRAAAALERGRARATGDAVRRQEEQVRNADRLDPQLLAAFRSAADRFVSAGAPQRGHQDAETDHDASASIGVKSLDEQLSGYGDAKEARAEYDTLLARIRAITPDFLQPNDPFRDVAAALAPGDRVAYLAAAGTGSAAIVLGPAAEGDAPIPTASAWWDERLTGDAVSNIANALLRAQEPGRRGAEVDAALARTADEVGADGGVLAQLASACRAEGVTHLVLIPCGLLGLLPLHAGSVPGGAHDASSVPFMDVVRVGYAPSARVWVASRTRRQGHPASLPNALVVGNPLPPPVGWAELNGAEAEARGLADLLATTAHGRVQSLLAEDATQSAVLGALRERGETLTLLHFACHGQANPSDPDQSALILANGARLMVRDLTDPANAIRFERLRLATLSACQTGILGTELPDEVVGLPTGWLQVGAAAVLASLWSVSDAATAALMTRFYELHLLDGLPPTDALWLAQRWLRGLPSWRADYAAAGATRSAAGPEAAVMVRGLTQTRGLGSESDDDAAGEGTGEKTARAAGAAVAGSPVQRKPGWERPRIWAAFAIYGD